MGEEKMISQYKRITQTELKEIEKYVQDVRPNHAGNYHEHGIWLGDGTRSWHNTLSIVKSLVAEVERLQDENAEPEVDSEAGWRAGLPAIGSRVYKAQPQLGVVYGDVTGIEIYDHDRIRVKFREIGDTPVSYDGFWMVDTFSTEVAARAALKSGESDTKNMTQPIEYGAPFDEPFL